MKILGVIGGAAKQFSHAIASVMKQSSPRHSREGGNLIMASRNDAKSE